VTALPDVARAHLDTRLVREQAEQRLPSVAAALVRRGQVVWSGAVGAVDGADGVPATADTQYRIGSITKTTIGVGVMRLAAEGSVALTDSIRDHLPELDGSLAHVSLTQLLTQSAGLAAETDGPWWERSPGLTWDELLPSIRLLHHPGRRFHYSNVGFAVLGRLIEKHRERPWSDVLTDEVFTPLGMTRTTYDPVAPSAPGLATHPYADLCHVEPAQDTGAMAPAGQLWSTVGDLARWATFLAAGDERILPDDLRRSMHVPAVVWDTPGQPWTRCYGLGLDVFNIDGRRFVGHGGSMPGFQASLLVDPATGTGVATLTNSTAGPSGRLGLDLVDVLEERAPEAPTLWRTSAAPDTDLLGTWFWGPRAFEVTARPDGGLTLGPTGGGGRWSTFAPNGDGTWTGQDDYWAGELLRAIDRGTPTAHLDLGSFRLSRAPYAPDADIPGGVDPQGWRA
jgi:CubicO group peptidase (beta-lactamase class C family)